jgi:NAD(P)-dependent dehydrogenase (short-subunit alcohol dehydrogenase family)
VINQIRTRAREGEFNVDRFKGKVVLVTGGATGIGQAAALAFAREGASVVIAGRRVDEGEEAVEQIKALEAEGHFVQTDVTREAEVTRLLEVINARYGRLDVAFNNAGHEGKHAEVSELDEAAWDAVVTVNLKGSWLCMKHEIEQMRKQGGGAIVNMATNLAYVGRPGTGAYSAAKAGVLALSRIAALENIQAGVRINVVSPGPVGTPMAERLFGSLENQRKRLETISPLGRAGKPEEIAAAVLWLSSPESSYVVGQDIVLDGGINIQ